LLRSNTIGLPNILEADAKEHYISDIFKFFNDLPSCMSILVRNVDKKTANWITSHVYRYALSSEKKLAILNKSNHNSTIFSNLRTDVKRQLSLKQTQSELGNTLYVDSISYDGFITKGINSEQFKKEFLTKDYDFFAINQKWSRGKPLLYTHLKEHKYKFVTVVRTVQFDRGPDHHVANVSSYLDIYGKDFDTVKLSTWR